MPPVITSALNTPADGRRLVVTLAGAPTGALTFYASRLPGELGDLVAGVTGGPTVYTVPVRAVATVTRMPYYLTARDNTGDSAQAVEWLCAGSSADWRQQVGDDLHQILFSNRTAIDRALRAYFGRDTFPTGESLGVRKIVRGIPAVQSDGKYPVLSVRVHALSQRFVGVPLETEDPIRAAIYAYVLHQGDVSWEEFVGTLGMAAFNVLNQAHYLEWQLPCGLWIKDAYCSQINTSETWEEGIGAWTAAAEIVWQAETHYAYET